MLQPTELLPLLRHLRSYKMYKLVRDEISGLIHSVRIVTGDVIKSIPINPDNTDYQAYLKWVAEGNEPEPAENT